jgi:hypothetical protein
MFKQRFSSLLSISFQSSFRNPTHKKMVELRVCVFLSMAAVVNSQQYTNQNGDEHSVDIATGSEGKDWRVPGSPGGIIFTDLEADWPQKPNKEDGVKWKAWQYRMCNPELPFANCQPINVAVSWALHAHGKYCSAGYLYKGAHMTVRDCAHLCYEHFGCKRFSVSCKGHCWISAGTHDHYTVTESSVGEIPADLQCKPQDIADADTVDKKVYDLSFYHADQTEAFCDSHFISLTGINTTAQCAHACKNMPDCRSFVSGAGTADGGCLHGCQVSKCEVNRRTNGESCKKGPDGDNCFVPPLDDPKIKHKAGNCVLWKLNSIAACHRRISLIDSTC